MMSVDPHLARLFHFGDKLTLKLAGEAFNVFNRTNISAVRTTQYSRSVSPADCGIAVAPCLIPQVFGTTAFGAPTSSYGPRILQLSTRISF
jgi:hypothetical protein